MTPASSASLSAILSSPEMLKVCWTNLFKDKEERVKQLTSLQLTISLGSINVAILDVVWYRKMWFIKVDMKELQLGKFVDEFIESQ
jgi:hypothetical protein